MQLSLYLMMKIKYAQYRKVGVKCKYVTAGPVERFLSYRDLTLTRGFKTPGTTN